MTKGQGTEAIGKREAVYLGDRRLGMSDY
jgi:hypothetical protein